MGDGLTTDKHGEARKHGDGINDNIDNLRPNQYPLGAKLEMKQPHKNVRRYITNHRQVRRTQETQ